MNHILCLLPFVVFFFFSFFVIQSYTMGAKTSKQETKTKKVLINLDEVSNDIVYEIFDHLSYHDILYAFKDLNQRFNLLIETYSHYVNLQNCNDQPLPEHILILRISNKSQLQFVDFSKVKSLRGLMLSNLSVPTVLNILNTIALDRLEYVYLGACDLHDVKTADLAEIQEKILSLGNQNLQKCVFRMKFLGNIDRLPETLSTLEYLRIDGCETALEVNRLLNRIPNLLTLYVSILSSNPNIDLSEEKSQHQCLTKLNIRFSSTMAFDDLNTLFVNHGSHVNKLILQLNTYQRNFKNYTIDEIRPKLLTIANEYLPQLTRINMHYRRLDRKDDLTEPKIAPQIEQIPSCEKHQAFQMTFSYN